MSFFVSLKRVLKFGWQAFNRNQGLNFEVIFIMTTAIFVLSGLFIFNSLSGFLIGKAQEKVDIAVYFKEGTEEKEIFKIKEELQGNFVDKIKSIDYVSKEKAKEIFLSRHKKDVYFQALEEVGENPFLPSLEIKAQDPIFYKEIDKFLGDKFKDSLWKISYSESREIINKISDLSLGIKKTGIVFNIILALLVFLITFNTIKLTIFVLRDEIATMRLVGSSAWFIQGPFFIQSFLYGVFSILLVNLLFFIGLYLLSPRLESWLFDFNLLENFKNNFLTILGWQITFTLLLSFSSSFFAIRKYLKI